MAVTQEKLYLRNIVFLKKAISAKNIEKYLRLTKGKVHIFFFENSVKSIDDVSRLIETVKTPKKHTVEYHLNIADGNLLFANKRLTEACAKVPGNGVAMASAFNTYRHIGRSFAEKYNLARFLPDSFLSEGTLVPDKTVTVVMLGAGKIANTVLESLILNNQFVTVRDGKYVVNPIRYQLFDINESAFDKKIVKLFSNKNNGELPAIVQVMKTNLKAGFCLGHKDDNDKLRCIPKPDENEFVFYFINIGNTLDNLTITSSLVEQLEGENAAIFYNVDSEKEKLLFQSTIPVLPFGFKDEILTRDKIVKAELIEKATWTNDIYTKMKEKRKDFSTLDIVEKLSNVYAEINEEFKLNLLGFTQDTHEGSKVVKKEEFYERYYGQNNNPVEKYEDYYKIVPINALRCQEHVRWLTYYRLNDFRKMELSDIKYDENQNKPVHKDLSSKRHACLVSYYDLDKVHHYEAQMCAEKRGKGIAYAGEFLKETETYKFDSQIMDNIFLKRKIYWLKKQNSN